MELHDVCLQVLNCATLYPVINKENHNIHLEFVGCNGEQVLFICKRVHSYKIVRHPDDKNHGYFVGEVNIEQQSSENFPSIEGWNISTTPPNKIDTVWLILISGSISIRIVCLDFSWELL